MGAIGPVALVALLAVASLGPLPTAGQRPDPNVAGDLLAPVLDAAAAAVIPQTEHQLGEDLSSEDVRIGLTIDVLSVDYALVPILFGGGRVAVDLDAVIHIEFRGVGMTRLDDALRAATGEMNASVRETFGVPTHRLALTSEEIRVIGGGILLQYMQEYEAAAARVYLESMLPGLRVLSANVAWSNTVALSSLAVPEAPERPEEALAYALDKGGLDLREPPLVLDATLRMQYVQHTSLASILQPGEAAATNDEALKEVLLERDLGGVLERPAFAILGYSQLLAFGVPPGWRLDMTLRVPEGFTIEGATSALVATGDRRALSYSLDGADTTSASADAAVATLSSRFLVTATLTALVALIGYASRLVVEAAVLRWRKP